jgi:hypothetical protein
MTTAAKDVLKAALTLEPDERAQLARELLESVDASALDVAIEEDAERSWNEELARRREKIARGDASFRSLEDLQDRVDKVLGGG